MIIISYIVFNGYIQINKKQKNIVEIDNAFKVNIYENNTSFSDYDTKLKPIALYEPEYNNISYLKYFNKNKTINELNFAEIKRLIKKQTQLAKNHGIYGFAIYFDLSKLNYYHIIISNFFVNKANFPFFLIWKNNDYENINNETLENIINNLKKYFLSDNYIKIRKKPVLSIIKPFQFNNSRLLVRLLREKAKELEIGEIFIFYPFTGNFTENKFLTEFDATYDFSKIDLFQHTKIKHNILYYSGIIYKNLILNDFDFNFPLYRSCNLNYKNFNDYNPEKFYIANKLIFEWIKKNFEENEGIVFIDSWNDYKNGKYLEPDEYYGYSSINTFSKSIFNLPFQQNNLNFKNPQDITIAIQVHAFYEDLFMDIINKLNLIPLKYDLFISTISKEKKAFIEKCLLNSTANNYEIKIFKNIGRDVFPFISQMKTKFKKYKYISHIHTKKSNHKTLFGSNWRNYIYSNLFGNENIVLEIILDFEKNEKLGFIFPETYYDLIKDVHGFDNVDFALNKPNKKYINMILQRIFKKIKIGVKLVFPAGNMFWAKTKAIYQIFNIRLRFPKELNQTNDTIMHGIERIWLYLVKLNGYYYKAILKHY